MAAADYEVLDARFARLVKGSAAVDRLYSGCRWAEGPAWFPAGRSLIWSDIPNDRMLRYDAADGSVSVFRAPCGYANGNIMDRAGRLVSCEHGERRVSRTEHDGRIITLVDSHDGKKLNSPNDLVEKSDGSIWFTDPVYGIESDYEGHKAEREQAGNYVYRLDARGRLSVVADDFVQPNGLAFSPDEKLLYVADTGRSHVKDGPRHIRVFAVGEEGRLSGGAVFAECDAGLFDGFRLDSAGRIWTSAGAGVQCYDPDGTLIGKINLPETVANLCFGGPKLNYLFICATSGLYGVRLVVNGARTF